jgi:class 3 adenylate cyclase
MGDAGAAGALPAGTVAFLCTDLGGSTRLLEADPAAYREAVRRHHTLVRGAVAAHRGAGCPRRSGTRSDWPGRSERAAAAL